LRFLNAAVADEIHDLELFPAYSSNGNTITETGSIKMNATDVFLNPHDRMDSKVAAKAILLAEQLLVSSLSGQTVLERREAVKLGRMMNDPVGKAFTFSMVDGVFRSARPSVAARRLRGILNRLGVPTYLPYFDRLLMRLGSAASYLVPGWVIPAIESKLRAESARVILPGESKPLHAYLAKRKAEGFRINLNHLGEAVLGESEANGRLEAILEHLADPEIQYVSVKISSIFSQINLVAWDQTLSAIKTPLRKLYRAAAARGKFVNLDMEEYRDLELTVAAFCGLLDESEFQALSAGIVLQAYLPDSWEVQRRLTQWARQRATRGGAPIKIRLVKGANLAMEKVEAELHGRHSAPYATKTETDSNFRRMLEYGCSAENAQAVRIGVASHNLFDIALALTLREQNAVEAFVELEMLEGMANHQSRTVRDVAGDLLLYAPAVKSNDFLSAMAYLVRRLDENTAPDNFLREMFAMQPGSAEWIKQKELFQRGWENRDLVSQVSRRSETQATSDGSNAFYNQPDTDWTQARYRNALNAALRQNEIKHLVPFQQSELPRGDTLLGSAVAAQPSWEALGTTERRRILYRAAEIMERQRFETIACMQSEGKKAVAEADSEVSEAVDFARYYARHAEVPAGVEAKSLGTVAVVSPWNFPYAIPAGGVLAALASGNSVILKPARATAGVARLLADQLWEAGVPRDVLQFFPCDNKQGQELITDPRLACVVLTGSYETANKFLEWRPSLQLYAETSGKNALVVTAQSDRELAIKDLVKSAFGHSGQKCSAASLAILEAEVYDSPDFLRRLRDATASLAVGPASDASSIITPTVIRPGEKLLRGLSSLDEGEEWLLQPKQIGDDPSLWSPGIRLGVKPGSWFHRTECFGPVLGLMRASSLQQAIDWQNDTEYGLTAGLHSLDPDEIDFWKEHVQAGNLYINRPITGAIVQRQPFGGWKKSSIGPGAKAGGANYVFGFYRLRDCTPNLSMDSQNDYAQAWNDHFAVEHDPTGLQAESNVFRYRPSRGVVLRVWSRNKADIELARLASEICHCPLTVSFCESESDGEFTARLPKLAETNEIVRTFEAPDESVLRAVHLYGLNWINGPILRTGRIELGRWLREQSVTQTRHRYGQIQQIL
jgi:RHH-type proline utilization regulon transcriptional repressor/proline dehydrogenase/delta 1-pyrroline-5-carboxylate dehydrogenase